MATYTDPTRSLVFRQRVLETVLNYGAGCLEGRRDFLRELGYDEDEIVPKTTYSVTLTIEIPEADNNGVVNRAEHVRSAIFDSDVEIQIAENLNSEDGGVGILVCEVKAV